MQIFSEAGLALEFVNDKVFMRIYPGSDILVEINRKSALYLYSLINKYNSTIRTNKWSSFWRRVNQIERTMVVMFINANTLDMWGEKFYFINEKNLPQDFLEAKNKKRLPTITPDIIEELDAIFNVYMKSTVTPEQVKNYWEEHYSKTCEIVKKHNQFDNLVKVCFEDNKIEKILQSVLEKEGYNAFEKPYWTDDYNEDTLKFLIRNEIGLFSCTGFQLVPR